VKVWDGKMVSSLGLAEFKARVKLSLFFFLNKVGCKKIKGYQVMSEDWLSYKDLGIGNKWLFKPLDVDEIKVHMKK
jgi:hypothetical protein